MKRVVKPELEKVDDLCLHQIEERIATLESLVMKQEKIDPDTLYTAAEILVFLKCGPANVYDLLRSGDLAVTKIGAGKGGLRVKGSDLSAFLESRRSGGPRPKSAFKYLKTFS
jgi:hypothetical protein